MFFKSLRSYIFILIIPLLMGIILYRETIRIVENNAREENLSILEQSVNIIDKNMAQINDLTIQFAFSTNVENFFTINSPLVDGTVVSDIKELQEYMYPYRILNKFIRMFYIYFRKSDIVISPFTTYIRIEDFYNYFFKIEGFNFFEFKEKVLNKPHKNEILPAATVKIDNTTSTMITYMQSLPINSNNDVEGCIMVLIDEKEISDMMNKLDIDGGGWWYISDQEGNVITSSPTINVGVKTVGIDFSAGRGYNEQEISGVKMLITFAVSSINNWRYVAAIPVNVVAEKAGNIKRIILLIMLISLLFGIVLSYWLSYHNSKPLVDIIELLRKNTNLNAGKNKYSYNYLKSSFSELVNSNQTLNEELRKQGPLLRSIFFNHFLNGNFSNSKEMEDLLDKADIYITGKRFAVVILYINDYNNYNIDNSLDELRMIKIFVKNILIQDFNNFCNWSDIDFDKIVLMLQFNVTEMKDLIENTEDFVKALKSTLFESYHINVSFSGSISEDLVGISRAFYEARQALNYRNLNSKTCIEWYGIRNTKKMVGYYYPIDIELRIIDLIKAGNFKGLGRLIQDIYRENFVIRNLLLEMKKQLINSMKGTGIRILDQIHQDKDNLLKQIGLIDMEVFESSDYKAIFNSLTSIFISASEAINSEKNNFNNLLMADIIEYLNNNYMNPNICLSYIAEYFNITEVYLSRFFKEQTKENFSKYVEKIRMEKAYELLSVDGSTVSEISKMVGYNSSHAFRRVFKRIYGKNPKE